MVVKVGLIGTGYAARKRFEALQRDERVGEVAIASQNRQRAQTFCQTYHQSENTTLQIESDWLSLVHRSDIDLVFIATENHWHGLMVRRALMADKHVVVEYPLSLDVEEANTLVALAQTKQRFLHVEHIEMLSSIHLVLKETLPQVGLPCYGRYASFKGERPAPQKWSYDAQRLGFPLVGALSRLQRLIDVFGAVTTISCQSQFWTTDGRSLPLFSDLKTYTSMVCSAHLTFRSGLFVELVYGKGDRLWSRERILDIHGTQGRIILEPQGGQLVLANGSHPLAVGSRQGLFTQDTTMVLDALQNGTPMYITPEASVYALTVADAARQSAETGQAVTITQQIPSVGCGYQL